MDYKKLMFGLCIFSVILLVSMPTAEAGVIGDLWGWLMEQFGFTQEEAEEVALTLLPFEIKAQKETWLIIDGDYVYTPNSKRNWKLRSGFNFHGNFLGGYVKREVEGKEKAVRTTKADNLSIDDGLNIEINLDKDYPLEIDNINFTDGNLTLHLNEIGITEKDLGKAIPTEKDLGKAIPMYILKKDSDGKEIREDIENRTFGSINTKEKASVSLKIGETLKYGEHSTNITIYTNDTNYFMDSHIAPDSPLNSGADTEVDCFKLGNFADCMFYINLYEMIGNVELINLSLIVTGNTGDSGYQDTYLISQHWVEGSGVGYSTEEPVSWDLNNNSGGYDWDGTLNNGRGALVHYSFIPPTIESVLDFSANITNFQTWIDNPLSNNGIFMDAVSGGVMSVDSKEGTTPPYWYVEYLVLNPPNNPTPELNSTDAGQTNATNEDLACNFLCDDPDASDVLTYDIDWYKDGVLDFSLDGTSCSDPEYVSAILKSGNTSKGDLWACAVTITDDTPESSDTIFSNNVTIENLAPSFTQAPTMNSTDGTNKTTQDLWCYFIPTDSDADTVTADVNWIKDNVSQFIFADESLTLDIENSFLLESENITKGELWNCEINLDDGTNTYNENSTMLEILGSVNVPIPYINSTNAAQTNLTNETLSCSFGCDTTLGGDTLTYTLNFLENSSRSVYSETDVTCSDTWNSINLESGNTSSHQSYNCRVNITSSLESYTTSSVDSNSLTIENLAPFDLTIVSPSPANQTQTPNLTINFNCTAEDLDDDTIYFEYYANSTNPPTDVTGNVTTNFTYTFIVDGDYWWRCRGVDEFGGASLYSNIRFLTIDNSTLKNFTANFSAKTTEGSSERFEFNVSYNPIQLDSIDANMIYENVRYDLTRVDLTDALTRFHTTINIPGVDGTTYNEFYLNVSNNFNNGSISYEFSVNYSQAINDTNIFQCDGVVNSSQALAVNFTFWDETGFDRLLNTTNTSIAVGQTDLDATFTIFADKSFPSANSTATFSIVNQTEVDFCISPADAIYDGDAHIQYVAAGYDFRFYFFHDAIFNNATQNVSLYLLEIALADLITVVVEDGSGRLVADAYIYAERFDVGTNQFRLVAMGRTDNEGRAFMFLRKNDAWYKFKVISGIEIVYQDAEARIISTDILGNDRIVLTIGEGLGFLGDRGRIENIVYSVTNTSDFIVLTYTDPTGVASENCLTVIQRNTTYNAYVCQECQTAASGTISCEIGTEEGEYIWGYYSSASPVFLVVSGAIERLTNALRLNIPKGVGLFASIFIILTLGLIGVAIGKVSSVVMFTLFGVVIVRILGLLTMSWTVFIGLVVAGIAYIILARS